MRAVLQRVTQASVSVAGATIGKINAGLLVLLGVGQQDTADDVAYMVTKTVNLRVFEDAAGLMNLSIRDTGGQVLVVSQFTLYGDCRKGRRPSFSRAAGPDHARKLYDKYIEGLRAAGLTVASGTFQATMEIALVNSGPVTLLLDSGTCI
ncbi:MAG: D-tyrosyl-tRNA(Tyr) deacylase [Deltaproteobacteria bacterium]|nr:D-tyrosyl-tRNA(Tyr) deacylase [Deltaproteobacteria bacterium]